MIGEGGNLGLSQEARIEYSLAGGSVNADFIDNAAGVNTSDREVNLKILLRSVEKAGLIDRAERNRILQDCAAEVVRSVLLDSERQTLAISVAEGYGVTVLDRHDQVMYNFAEHGLDRLREHLPGSEEIERRRAAGRGLTRPEIAAETTARRGGTADEQQGPFGLSCDAWCRCRRPAVRPPPSRPG